MPGPEVIDAFRGEYRFLSNFWPTSIAFEGVTYPSVEHAYQAAKASDDVTRARIADAPTARDARRMGRAVPLDDRWEERRLTTMRALVEIKFRRYDLARRLAATGDAELIEGNSWGDRYWGVCDGEGANHLGRILMEVRAALRT